MTSATMTAAPKGAPAPSVRPLKAGDQIFLVDGSSFVFRAYFQSMNQDRKYNVRPSDGLPTGALRLFCTKLYQFIREGAVGIKPTHLAIIFDKTEDTFRKAIYADYKANRTDPPPELVPQFPLMREAVKAFGLIPIEEPGFEADDLIATYSCRASEAGAQTLSVSADKDLMQLVHDGVTFYDFESGIPGKPGYRPERRLDRAAVIEKFGVPPEQVPDVQALVGDPTDNVPGVPGVGPKAAAALISELGSLEAILAYKDRPDALDAMLQERLAALQGEIDALAGQPVKINSGGQIAEVLAQKFGIEDLPLDKKGRPTADAETLERLGCDHPFCRTLVRARNLSRAIGATTRKVLENAEQALVSKRLVTLDRLDPKRLVAFLKALELNQLVRRIAEAYAVDVAEVEPDPRLRSGAGGITWDQAQFQAAERGEPPTGAGAPARAGTNGAGAAVAEGEAAAVMVPAALAARRATEVAKIPFDTEAYRCIASVEELDAVLARGREFVIVALATETD